MPSQNHPQHGKPDETPSEAQAPAGPRPGRLRRYGRRFLALAIGCLVAVILTELAVDLLLGTQPKFPRHVVEAPWGIRYNEPDSHYRHESPDGQWYFRINGQGMRADRDYTYEKPEGVKRIISLGDSFTIGYEVDHEQTFSKRLEQRLNDAGFEVQVLNCGVSGFSTAEELVYLKRELLKYEPDLVIVSFFGNDVIDNRRSALFKLADGELQQRNERYVPGGELANFLNTNWLFNFLAARSDAFTLAKERATRIVKRQLIEANEEQLDRAAGDGDAERAGAGASNKAAADDPPDRQQDTGSDDPRRLAGAIFRRMHELLRERDIPLLIQNIPNQRGGPDAELIEQFPHEHFDTNRPGVHFISMREHLQPFVGNRLLYNQNSHYHWTPFAHDRSAEALAEAVRRNNLLSRDEKAAAPAGDGTPRSSDNR